LARLGQAKNSDGTVRGQLVKARMHKNSYGPASTQITFEIRTSHTLDTPAVVDESGKVIQPAYMEPVIHFDAHMLDWMIADKLLDVTRDGPDRYTCKSLGVFNESALMVGHAFHKNTELMNRLGRERKMLGYFDKDKEIGTD
jgi:hypothetical protein